MLSSLVKKHNDDLAKLREAQENRKKEAMSAATDLTNAMVDHLNVGVAQAYLNEKKLDSEMRTLTTNASQFAKQTQQWLALIDNFNTALKELGHVQSWAKAIESDVKTITSALEYVYKSTQETPRSSAGSGGGSGSGSIS
ncbi:Biogenesis of lysosome-related organelles complex 1 subunit 1 [Orchesella cincta]|uniref:Biogenesis of lysosome-related organelles complex 1 subunit 1 n=1 Tax=Orchesella cincta TaxID=48709 RepID=A0A1D2N5H1_ORCCI|nr:Biogenesis of lysosome-related organelles complex 1 subunit 1 [Orchesella cincta]